MEFKDSHYIAIIFNEFQSFVGGHIWIWGSMFMSWLIVTLTFVPLDTWKKKSQFWFKTHPGTLLHRDQSHPL